MTQGFASYEILILDFSCDKAGCSSDSVWIFVSLT